MKAAARRRKGIRIEAEIVARHKALGVHAERYPLSGASRFRGSGHDVDIYLFGRDAAPLVCEVKARKYGAGFAQLESWLGEYACLFLRRNNADPLVCLPWQIWESITARLSGSLCQPNKTVDALIHTAKQQGRAKEPSPRLKS